MACRFNEQSISRYQLSSSFADELIGKLIAKLGFLGFMKHITISNTNEFNSLVINRSVGQRMAQIYMDERIDEAEDSNQ